MWPTKRVDASPRFLRLEGGAFESLVTALVTADALRVGLTVDDIEWDLDPYRPDGGVDALIRRQPTHPELHWVTRPAVFQAKRSLPTKADLKIEFVKPRVKEALLRGDDYVLVTGAPPPRDANEKLLALIRGEYPRWKGSGRVLGDANLVHWMSLFPSTWQRMPDEAWRQSVQSFETWRKKLEAVTFVRTAERQQVFDRLAKIVVDGGVLHVEGLPGVGKTRCVLEALNNTGPLTAYLPGFVPEVLSLPIEAGASLYGCLVIDECSKEQRRAIAERFSASPTLRIVTIGADLERVDLRPSGNSVRLEVIEGEALDQLATGMRPELPLETRKRVSRLCGGYPKLMELMFAAGERYPENQDLWDAVVKYLGEARMKAEAFFALALPRYFQVDDLESLSKAVGRSTADLREAKLHLSEMGLLGDVDERRHYVTPLLLGEYLARRFWKEPDAFDRLRKNLSVPLLRECVSRLAQLGPEGAKTLSAIGAPALLDALGLEQTAELSSAIAAENRDQVLDVVRRLLPRLIDPKDRARFVPAIRIAAWFGDSLSPAIDLLTELVGDTKQAAEPLRSLFGAHLGLTRADGPTRLAAIERLVRSPVPRQRRMGFLLAAAATEVDVGGFIPQLPEPVENAWRPASRADEANYRQGAATLLALGLKDPDAETALLAQDEVTRAVRGLVRAQHAGASAILLQAWAATGLPIAPLTSVIDTVEVHDRDFLSASGLAESTAFREAAAALAPRGMADRLSMVARPASWGEPDPEAIERVAQAAMSAGDLSDVADWCFSNDAVVAVEIGRSLAEHDAERRLLPMLLERAPAQNLVRTSASYCAALRDIDHLLEGWSAERSLARFCFEIFWLLDPTAGRVEALGGLLRRGFLQPRAVEQLLLGGWLLRAPRTSALDFVELIAETQPLSAFRLAFQLLPKEQSEGPATVAPDELLRSKELLSARWFAVPIDQVKGTQLEWEWSTAARRIATTRPLEVGLHLLKTVRNESLPSEFQQLLDSLLPKCGPALLLPVLAILEAEPFRATGGAFRGIADFPDHRVLEEWATTVERARVLVRVGIPIAPGGVLERLLEKFSIGSEMEALFFTGSFVGSESDWLERKKAQLQPLLSPPASPSLRGWAKRLMKRLEADIARSRSVQKAYEIGVLPLPWVAER